MRASQSMVLSAAAPQLRPVLEQQDASFATTLLVISFILIVVLFLSILLPFQQSQLRRFIDERSRFLDVLVEARRGDICHWWIQESVGAHWHQFQKTILGHPNIRHASLYCNDNPIGGRSVGRPPTERLVVTSDPILVERGRVAALAAGVQFQPNPAARGLSKTYCTARWWSSSSRIRWS